MTSPTPEFKSKATPFEVVSFGVVIVVALSTVTIQYWGYNSVAADERFTSSRNRRRAKTFRIGLRRYRPTIYMCGMGKHGQVKRRDRQISGMQIQACLDKFDLDQYNI